MARFLLKAGLVVLSVFVGLVVAELMLRVMPDESLPASTAGSALMFSSPTWQLDDQEAVRYLPNRDIRTVAVQAGHVAYDISFRTNNLGLIDHRDYRRDSNPHAKHYAFVGDSFTAGYHGDGVPWAPRLRDGLRNRKIDIYNLGIDGTGVEHFRRLLNSVSRQLPIDAVAVVAISDDFLRRFWYPVAAESDIRLCTEREVHQSCGSIAGIMRADMSVAETEKMATAAAGKPRGLLKDLRMLALAKRAYKDSLWLFGLRKKNPEWSLNSLKGIREAFPSMETHLIHLPQREEVVAGRYAIDIGGVVTGMGIDYFPALERCRWSPDMYLAHDNHPNDSGYRNIADCVAGYLFNQ